MIIKDIEITSTISKELRQRIINNIPSKAAVHPNMVYYQNEWVGHIVSINDDCTLCDIELTTSKSLVDEITNKSYRLALNLKSTDEPKTIRFNLNTKIVNFKAFQKSYALLRDIIKKNGVEHLRYDMLKKGNDFVRLSGCDIDIIKYSVKFYGQGEYATFNMEYFIEYILSEKNLESVREKYKSLTIEKIPKEHRLAIYNLLKKEFSSRGGEK